MNYSIVSESIKYRMAKYLTREEYMSIIGFFGNTALIDKNIFKKAKKFSFEELLAQNMIRECVCDALYTNDEEKKKKVCAYYFDIKTFDNRSDNLESSTVTFFSQKQHNSQQNNYTTHFKSLVQEYGVLEEILNRELNKKFI